MDTNYPMAIIDEYVEMLEHILDTWTAPNQKEFKRLHLLLYGTESCTGHFTFSNHRHNNE